MGPAAMGDALANLLVETAFSGVPARFRGGKHVNRCKRNKHMETFVHSRAAVGHISPLS